MNDIRTLLALARRRLEWSRFLGKAHFVVIALGALAALLMLADRSTSAGFVPWRIVAPTLAVFALATALWLWLRRRMTELQVAIAVDEKLDLREKLSTALHCSGREDPFARAAVEDAVGIARDPKTRERARRLIKVSGPRGWWAGPMVVVVALLLAWMPQLDLFSRKNSDVDPVVQQTKLEAEKSLAEVVELIKKDESLTKSMSDLLGELTKDPMAGDSLKSAADIRRDAIKKVSDLHDRLEDILKGQEGATADALQKSLKDLNGPQEDGAAKDFADALKAGDFKAASQALQQMAKQAEGGQMSPEQMQKLGEQMQKIADQLNQMAQQQQALEQALKQAGLDPQLAQNPQALQQALQNNQNLNQQQKQQIQQQAQAQQAACKACQGMGQMCQGMAQAMKQGNGQQAGQQGQGLQQALDKMEAMQQMMQMAQAAANSCKNGGQGLGQSLGLSQQQQLQMQAMLGGGGMDGRLEGGQGGQKTRQKTPTASKLQQDSGKDSGDGDVIFRQFIDGDHIVGESTAKLKAAVATATEGLKQGVDEDQIPRKYEEAHKHYFGELEKKIKAEEAKQPKPAAAPAGSAPPAAAPQGG